MKTERKIGELVRIGASPTSVMRITDILTVQGGLGPRYAGRLMLGGTMTAFETRCQDPTAEDVNMWYGFRRWRELAGRKSA